MASFYRELLASGISFKSQKLNLSLDGSRLQFTQNYYYKITKLETSCPELREIQGSKAGKGHLGRSSNASVPANLTHEPNKFLFLLSPNSREQPQKCVLCLVQGLMS